MFRSNVVAGIIASWLSVLPSSAAVTASNLFTLGMPNGFTYTQPSSNSFVGGTAVGSGFGATATNSYYHAILWSAAVPAGSDLNPMGFVETLGYGGDGNKEVGKGYGSATNFVDHALMWSGTASSVVDLHPTGFSDSQAVGVRENDQVGFGTQAATGKQHALLWHGAATSAIDLHPTNIAFATSAAYEVRVNQEVGYGNKVTANDEGHALLWLGTADSAVDLSPSGMSLSRAFDTDGLQQVGVGRGTVTSGHYHALLWSGTADSVIDLAPFAVLDTFALAIGNGMQAGYGVVGTQYHALLWSGSAQTYIDLDKLLPFSTMASYAVSIKGNVIYGYAIDTNDNFHAVAWTVPEPTGVSVLAASVAGLASRRRRNLKRKWEPSLNVRTLFRPWLEIPR